MYCGDPLCFMCDVLPVIERSTTMRDEEKALNEAQKIANTPTTPAQLLPHERVLCHTMRHICKEFMLTDEEILSSLDRIRGYLHYNLDLKAKESKE